MPRLLSTVAIQVIDHDVVKANQQLSKQRADVKNIELEVIRVLTIRNLLKTLVIEQNSHKKCAKSVSL